MRPSDRTFVTPVGTLIKNRAMNYGLVELAVFALNENPQLKTHFNNYSYKYVLTLCKYSIVRISSNTVSLHYAAMRILIYIKLSLTNDDTFINQNVYLFLLIFPIKC